MGTWTDHSGVILGEENNQAAMFAAFPHDVLLCYSRYAHTQKVAFPGRHEHASRSLIPFAERTMQYPPRKGEEGTLAFSMQCFLSFWSVACCHKIQY